MWIRLCQVRHCCSIYSINVHANMDCEKKVKLFHSLKSQLRDVFLSPSRAQKVKLLQAEGGTFPSIMLAETQAARTWSLTHTQVLWRLLGHEPEPKGWISSSSVKAWETTFRNEKNYLKSEHWNMTLNTRERTTIHQSNQSLLLFLAPKVKFACDGACNTKMTDMV